MHVCLQFLKTSPRVQLRYFPSFRSISQRVEDGEGGQRDTIERSHALVCIMHSLPHCTRVEVRWSLELWKNRGCRGAGAAGRLRLINSSLGSYTFTIGNNNKNIVSTDKCLSYPLFSKNTVHIYVRWRVRVYRDRGNSSRRLCFTVVKIYCFAIEIAIIEPVVPYAFCTAEPVGCPAVVNSNNNHSREASDATALITKKKVNAFG